MSPELDKKLVEDFPLLFSDRYKPMTETCMCWGFAVEDGWEPIIREAAEKLEHLIQNFVKEHPDRDYPRASQVKEKFGTLRFYLTSGTDEMWNIVSEAEQKSETTCEVCGHIGELVEGGWLQTLCEEHSRK